MAIFFTRKSEKFFFHFKLDILTLGNEITIFFLLIWIYNGERGFFLLFSTDRERNCFIAVLCECFFFFFSILYMQVFALYVGTVGKGKHKRTDLIYFREKLRKTMR